MGTSQRLSDPVAAVSTSTPSVRILVANPSADYRSALVRLLGTQPMEIVGEAQNTVQLCLSAERLRPDVILLDPELPGINGLETFPKLAAASPPPAVIFLSLVRGEVQRESERIIGARFLLKEHAGPRLIEHLLELARLRECR